MQNGLPATCQAMQLKVGETAKFPKIDETFQNRKGPSAINLPISQDCNYGIMSYF